MAEKVNENAKYKAISGHLSHYFGFKLSDYGSVLSSETVCCVSCDKCFAYYGWNTSLLSEAATACLIWDSTFYLPFPPFLSPPFVSLSIPSLPSPSLLFSPPSLPLEVGSLNPARGLGNAVRFPSGVWGSQKSNSVHFSHKI